MQFDRRRVTRGQCVGEPSLETQVPHIQHLGIDVGKNLIQIVIFQDVKSQVRRVGNIEIVRDLGRSHWGGLVFTVSCPSRRIRLRQLFGFGGKGLHQLLPFVRILNGVSQSEPGHGVTGVGDQTAVFRGDA